jgi:hypothetical protein
METTGNFPMKSTLNPETVKLPYIGNNTSVRNFEYDEGEMYKKVTISSSQVTKLHATSNDEPAAFKTSSNK